MQIKVKRAYEEPAKQDGTRVLVDRIWPRGIKKEEAKINEWLKDVAPSTELRKWFGHEPEKWPEFKKRYFRELNKHKEAVQHLREIAAKGQTTLVFAAKNAEQNNAVALKEYLENRV